METVTEPHMNLFKKLIHTPAVIKALLGLTVVGAPIAFGIAWALHFMSRLPWL